MTKKLHYLIIIVLLSAFGLNVVSWTASSRPAQAAQTLPAIPAGLKSTLMLGLGNQPDQLSWMTDSGAAWDARYAYLCGGVNTGKGWATWNDPAGSYATYYMNESASKGYLPIFTYYQLLQSSPASGLDEGSQDFNNLNNPSTMQTYYADFKLLMEQASTFGKTVVVQVEPDLWGFLQKRSANPSNLSASVASSGYAAVASYPNTVAGFAQALVSLRDHYAPNVLLGFHISLWGASQGDLGTSHDPNFDVTGAAQETANFYLQTGANFDLLFYDIADRDAAYYAGKGDSNHWWDTTNQNFPNFNRFHQYVAAITSATGKRGMLWQVPVGNTLYATLNNTPNHWQDNRVQYYLNDSGLAHLQDLANSGILGVLFGAGNNDTTSYYDAAHDSITNLSGNLLTASVSDDDGGYLRSQAQSYYAHGALLLPDSGLAQPQPTVSSVWQSSVSVAAAFDKGATVSIATSFQAPSGATGDYQLDIELYNTDSGQLVHKWQPVQTLTPSQSYTINSTWTADTNGHYQVRLGVFTPEWSLLNWKQDGPVFQVD